MTYVKDHAKDPTKGITSKITRKIADIQIPGYREPGHESKQGIEEILQPERLYETQIDFDEFKKYCSSEYRKVFTRARNIIEQTLRCRTYGDIYNKYLEQKSAQRDDSFIFFLVNQKNARERTVMAICEFLNYKGIFRLVKKKK